MSDDPDLVKQLLETVRLQAQTIHELTARNSHDIEYQSRETRRHLLVASTRGGTAASPWRPLNVAFRRYDTFRAHMVELESLVPSDEKKTKANVCALGSDTVKTVNRAMEHFHLKVRQWPPSSWPVEEPAAA